MKRIAVILCALILHLNATASIAGWGSLVDRPELDSWIKNALIESPVMQMARERLQVSGMNVRSVSADRRPELAANITARAGQESTRMTDRETEDLEPFVVGAKASWELDVFGRLRSEIGAARFAETAAEHALKDREIDFASDIVSHYVQGIFRAEQRKLQEEIVKSDQSIVNTLRGRHNAGLLSSQELDNGIAQLQTSLQKHIAVNEAEALLAARWSYLVSTNSVPKLSKVVDKGLASIPKLPDEKGIHAYAINRPDVRAAYALWQRADSQATAVSRRRLPSVQAIASAEGTGPSPVNDPEEWSAWAGIKISLPVLAPRDNSDVELEKARSRLERSLYEEVARRALLDIREAYVKRLHSEKKLKTAITAAERLKTKFESEERKHKQGIIIKSELEKTRLTWLKAREKVLVLHAATLEQHIEFVRACGGPEKTQD